MNLKKTINLKKLILISALFILLPFTAKADIYKDNNIPNNIKAKIERIVDAPSHLDGIDNFERKPKNERIEDNIKWYKKYGIINTDYNKYGLDIKNYRNQDDYIPEKEFKRFAIHHGNINPRDHINLSKNKMITDKIIGKHYPDVIPKTYFKFKGEKIITTKDPSLKGFKNTKLALKSLKNGKYFIKEVTGSLGNNAILLTKKNNNLNFRHVTKGEISLEEFLNITNKTDFMIEEHIENHETLKKLSPFALSTIRIVTTRFHDDVHIFSTDLRVSCQENAIVDNFHKHGAIVHVNIKTGRLAKYAHRRTEKSLKVHPISNIKFENYKLPYWKETLAIVKKLHKLFPELSSLGWDVAITPTGPKIIEVNGKWDIAVPQVTVGGVKKKWEHFKNI